MVDGVVSGNSSSIADFAEKRYSPPMITLEADEKEYHLTIPREVVNERRLETFVQWLRDESAAQDAIVAGRTSRSLAEIAANSQMTAADADRLAASLTAGWWARNQKRFLPEEKPGA